MPMKGGREGGRVGQEGRGESFFQKGRGTHANKYKRISYDKTHMLKKLPRKKDCMQNTET
jgi:hypothetical protein